MVSNHFWVGPVEVGVGADNDTSLVDRKMSYIIDEAKPFPLAEQVELDIGYV